MRAAILSLLLLVGCCSSLPLSVEVPRGYSAAQATMVALVDFEGDPFCSGVVVGSNRVLTAAHCVDEGRAVFVAQATDRSGTYGSGVPAFVLRTDEAQDLALLVVTEPLRLERVSVAEEEPEFGAPVVACGMPFGEMWVCNAGRVSTVTRYGHPEVGSGWFMVDAGLIPGMSGGPVYDAQGRLVGIVQFYKGTHLLGGARGPGAIRDFLNP